MLTLYKFKNLKTEGNYLFQYVHGRKLSGIYHTHDFYEIIIIIRGECTKLINDEEFVLKKDSIIFLKPDDCHVFLSQSKDVCVASLSVQSEEFEKIHGMLENAGELDTSVITYVDAYSKFCSLISGFSNDPVADDCKLFLFFLLRIFHSTPSKKEYDKPNPLAYAVKEMERSENLKKGTEAFTELSGYSRSHLAKLMKKHYGKTVHEYIFELKMSKAYRQITLTSTPLEEIAENIGYESFSHFNQAFKKRYGVTPAALRKSNKAWTV